MKLENSKHPMKDKIYRALSSGDIETGALSSMTLQELAEEISTYHQELVYQNEELLRQTVELKAVQERYRELFDDAPIGYIVLDEDYRIVAANKTFAKMVHMDVAEVKSRYLTSLIHPESQDPFYLSMRELNRKGYAEILELHLTGSAGTVRTRCSLNSYVDEGKKLIRMAFLDDQEQLKMILQTIPAPVIVVRLADKVIVDCNETFEEVSGYAANEVVGRNHRDLGIYTDLARLDRMVAQIVQQGYCKNFEMIYKTKGGQQVIGLVSARVLSLSGQPHILAVIQDVTTEKAATKSFQESEKRYRMLAENMQDVIWTCDPETGRFLYISPSVQELLGYTPAEMMARPAADHFTADSAAVVRHRMADTLADFHADKPPVDHCDEVEQIRKDGSTIWTEGITRYFFNPETGRAEISGVTRDISARKQAEAKLRQSEAKYRALLEQANQAIVVIQRGVFQYCNPHTVEVTGYEVEEIIGSAITDFIHPEDVAMVRENHIRRLAGEAVPARYECRILRKNGTVCWAEFSVVLVEWEGESANLVFVNDITDRKLKEQEIQYLSYHDQLTGLFNRRYYEEALERFDQPAYLPCTLILGDVNGLKMTNDAFGHLAGDGLLQTIAATLTSVCRQNDVAARIGGDEFVLLLPGTSAQEGEQVVRRLQEEISRQTSGHVVVSLSLGWATKTDVLEPNSRIYMLAEEMMYSNKLTDSPAMKQATLDRIIRTLYERSHLEEEHAKRVSLLCEQTGIALRLDSRRVVELKAAALMHDIGKISLDVTNLYKREPLCRADRLDNMRHPEIGYTLLSALADYSTVAKIVLAHHEHWDGTGYPKGLSGDDIPLESRIIHVVDAYDAMVNGLDCSEPLDKEAAIRELRRLSGSQFDADLVRVFLEQVLPTASTLGDDV